MFWGFSNSAFPEGRVRHLDALQQSWSPHCLATIVDSRLPSSQKETKEYLNQRGT